MERANCPVTRTAYLRLDLNAPHKQIRGSMGRPRKKDPIYKLRVIFLTFNGEEQSRSRYLFFRPDIQVTRFSLVFYRIVYPSKCPVFGLGNDILAFAFEKCTVYS